MPEVCLSRSCISQIYRVVCTDFVLLFSFAFCHPLYVSYFVFFSPYLYKLMSFLSPLFVTISLVLLAVIYDSFAPRLSEPGSSLLLSAVSAVFDILSSKCGDDFKDFEELEVYKIVFLLDETEVSGFGVVESAEAEVSEPECEEKYCLDDVDQVLALGPGSETQSSTEFPLIEEKKEMLHFPAEKEVDFEVAIFNKVLDVEHEASKLRIGSEAVDINIDRCDNAKEHVGIVKSRIDSYNKIVKNTVTNERHFLSFDNEGTNLGSYGSMRKEKEWKRTLACKLFEERHYNVVEGGEGMDSLWETYESDSTKPPRKEVKKKNSKKKSYDLDYNGNADEDDEEFEMTNGHLCCLQAFKFSARKVNMGMGRSNIVKITKALKGIGWLHNVKKHDRKEKS